MQLALVLLVTLGLVVFVGPSLLASVLALLSALVLALSALLKGVFLVACIVVGVWLALGLHAWRPFPAARVERKARETLTPESATEEVRA